MRLELRTCRALPDFGIGAVRRWHGFESKMIAEAGLIAKFSSPAVAAGFSDLDFLIHHESTNARPSS